jgi:hypothetical protein
VAFQQKCASVPVAQWRADEDPAGPGAEEVRNMVGESCNTRTSSDVGLCARR